MSNPARPSRARVYSLYSLEHVPIGPPPRLPGSYELTAAENVRLLRVIAACAGVTNHRSLYQMAQAELQFFLPHDVLVGVWGDFGADQLQFDVISSLSGMRTGRLRPGAGEVTSLARGLHARWTDAGRRPFVLNESVAELRVFPGMGSLLVHGTRNERDDCDNLYIALRAAPLFVPHGDEKRLLALVDSVIHQLDIAFTKVAALRAEAPAGERRAPQHARRRRERRRSRPAAGPLTARETEVAEHLSLGRTNAHIAGSMNISVNTVKNHIRRIFEKLGASNRTEAMAKFMPIANGR
jgi:transcriptional regulator EpsA